MMHVVVYWLLYILLFVGNADHSLGLNDDSNVTVTGSCIEEERQALLMFKADLKDIHGSLNDWSNAEEKRDCCIWSCVSCDDDTGHVIELRLSYSSLVGKINPSIKLLNQLEKIDFIGNDFQFNHVPNFLGSLTNLWYLDISNANLSGPIPHQLGNLSNLAILDLSGNSLGGSIPLSFGALTSLTYLNLSVNHLEGIIPKSLGNCSSMTYLDLSENLLNGFVPSFAGWSSSMIELYIDRNTLQGGVPNFTGWSPLSKLSLADNSLNGSIPDFTGCESLRELDLSGNQLSGNLPNSLGHVSNLKHLDVSSNSLNGVISDLHFENLTQLTYLDMSFNSLAFELSSLPFQLNTIKLQSCELGTSSLVWIKSQRNFRHLDISNTGISGIMPLWFWDLPLGLQFLNLSSNELRGMLPNITSDFDEYPGIDLSNNRFEGRVPLLPSKLASLKLSGNKFKGDLSFLCHIDGELTLIDLSNNSFSGSLPDCWSRFQKLIVLNLSNNNLSGKIPLSFIFLYQLEALYLRKNAFDGELPMSLSNCTNLRFVDIGENKLSGKIPVWVGERLTELYVLVLRSNMFNGSLPIQICWLYNLHILDLSKNGLVGNIPSCFGNFTYMSSNRSRDDMTYHSYSSYSHYKYKYRGGARRNCNPHDRCRSAYYHLRHLAEIHYISYSALANSFEEVLQEFIDNAWVAWKGTDRSFGRILKLLKSIDLSNNNLSGTLPGDITSLVALLSLNISLNKLHGELPKDIGRLRSLESLDLSRNQFSGKIPLSLSQLNFLSYLDLSNNNLSGVIPTGTQLQRLNCSSYIGNPQLHGPPLTPSCGITPAPPTVDVNEDDEKHGDDEFWESYYMGMGTGFAVGFWGLCGVIFLNRQCRHLLFASLSLAKDWIYVTVVVLFRKI